MGHMRSSAIIEVLKGIHHFLKDTRGRGGNRRVSTEIKLPLPPDIGLNIETLGTLIKRTTRSEKRSLNHNQIIHWLQIPEKIHDAVCNGPFYWIEGQFILPYAFASVTVESAIVTYSPKGASPFVKIEFKSYIPKDDERRFDNCTCFANHPVFSTDLGVWKGNDEYPHRYLVPIEEVDKRRIEDDEEGLDEAACVLLEANRRERLDQLLANGQASILG